MKNSACAGARRRAAAGIAGAAILLSGCSTAPAAGPPSDSTTTAAAASPDPTPTSSPSPTPTPEQPRPSGWLAEVTGDVGRLAILGDSFAAGEGAGDYQPAVSGVRDSCHRSLHPPAAELFAPQNIANLACSRATTGHLTAQQRLAVTDPGAGPNTDPGTVPAQLEQLRGFEPTLVVLSVGGNNLDFAGILQACLLETTPCSDDPQLAAHAAEQLSALEADLVDAYAGVAAAVSAPVLVLPYPQLFDEPGGDCGRLSTAEQRFGRDLINDLNAVIRSAVDSSSAPNIYYVDAVEQALAGHGACSPEPFVHAADVSGLLKAADSFTANQELLHPTSAGYRAMTAELVRWAAEHPVPH
ncbi:SGNH/GDSL hydrolase family protein [Arthrobacter sp. zg-Y895]|uniref:SGNH/GDSL hydrolase family protein n=1 Tax=Arthrobacter sp. zg-Y895 TaxID=2886933 RepID=UPI001D13452C|nr:SGNH/GDSL hydrolase family protein [Arthrobacter sp. zg-Y895]MCC3302205.1 SGNH/GDSL hydrolase family protein [Arthrobacter sp. zg-Y895]